MEEESRGVGGRRGATSATALRSVPPGTLGLVTNVEAWLKNGKYDSL